MERDLNPMSFYSAFFYLMHDNRHCCGTQNLTPVGAGQLVKKKKKKRSKMRDKNKIKTQSILTNSSAADRFKNLEAYVESNLIDLKPNTT